jgi:hypothetical protein
MRLRSGAISSVSRGKAFTAWWTSYLAATHASHSAQQANNLEVKILDISGRLFQPAFVFYDQEFVSLKTSKATLPKGCITFCATWESWVIERHGEYLARLNAARHTSESDFSYLPTPCANEDSFRLNGNSQQSKTLEAKARRGELKTIGSVKNVDCLSFMAAHATMLNLSVLNAANGHTHLYGTRKMDAQSVEQNGQAGATQQRGPLNPQFVEAMMGLPIGWTDCVSSETELSRQQQP